MTKTNRTSPRFLLSMAAGLGMAGLSYTAQAAPSSHGATLGRPSPTAQLRTQPQLAKGALAQGEARRGKRRGEGHGDPAARKAKRLQMMRKLDTNRDGQVQISEILALKGAKMEARLRKMDTNHDGVIQPEERRAAKASKKGRHLRNGKKARGQDKAHRQGTRGRSKQAKKAPRGRQGQSNAPRMRAT